MRTEESNDLMNSLRSRNAQNNLVTPAGNFPSFLKIYLGRALKIEDGTNTLYMDIEPGFMSASLSPKDAVSWEYTFEDLPKYGKVTLDNTTTQYPYVYFVSEVIPIGFHNTNSEEENTVIGTEKYFVASGNDNQYSFTLKNQEDITHELSVCKLVTGNMGNKAKNFTFDIEFKDENGKLLKGTGFTTRFTDVYDSTYLRSRTYTLENGRISISLPHGKKVQFLSIPEGTHYTITETDGNGYKTISGTYTGEAITADTSGFPETIQNTGTLTNDTDYLYVNDLTVIIPTGISSTVRTSMLLFMLPVIPIGYILYVKRRKKNSI